MTSSLPPTTPQPQKSCAKCNKLETETQPLVPCQNCFSVFYCSPSISSCQQTHFPSHQDDCMLLSSKMTANKKKMMLMMGTVRDSTATPSSSLENTTTFLRRSQQRRRGLSASASPRSRSGSRRALTPSSLLTPKEENQNGNDRSDDEMPSLVDYDDVKTKKVCGVEISTQTTNEVVEIRTNAESKSKNDETRNFKYHDFKENENDDDDDEPPPLDPLQDGTIKEFPKVEKKQYSEKEEEEYQNKMNYFKGVEFEKAVSTLATDEKLQRAMVDERRRMERQELERELENNLIQTRDLLIEAVRSKLKQQSTFTAYYNAETKNNNNNSSGNFDSAAVRKSAQDELTKLNEMVELMKGFVVEPREVDVQLFKSRNVLLQTFQDDISKVFRKLENGNSCDQPQKEDTYRSAITAIPKPASQLLFPASQNKEVSESLQELSLKERCKIVVQIKDLCDKLKSMKMNALGSPTRYASIEELYKDGVEVANRVPVAGTLTLMATKAELERFLRIYQV